MFMAVPNNPQRVKLGKNEKILMLLACMVQFRKADLNSVVRFQNGEEGRWGSLL